jgi:hypothetical protein
MEEGILLVAPKNWRPCAVVHLTPAPQDGPVPTEICYRLN